MFVVYAQLDCHTAPATRLLVALATPASELAGLLAANAVSGSAALRVLALPRRFAPGHPKTYTPRPALR